jgi:hypothetical protein
MRKTLSLFLFLTILAVAIPGFAVRLNTPAPDFTLKELQGADKPFQLTRASLCCLTSGLPPVLPVCRNCPH